MGYICASWLFIYLHFSFFVFFILDYLPFKTIMSPKNVTCKRCYKKGNGDQGKSFSKLTSVTYYYNFKTVFLINM